MSNRLTNNRDSTTVGNEMLKKESKTSKYKRLNNYQWGVGLEHEVQFFHKPSETMKKNIDSYIMFNGKPIIEDLLKKNVLSLTDQEFLKTIPFEPTGRKCNGKVVLEKTPIPMPEFITEKPFNTLKKKKSIELYCREIREKEEKYIKLLRLSDKTVKLEQTHGMIREYPFGMTNYFKYNKNDKSSSYTFDKTKDKKDKLHTDYLGSYHITLTLPFTDKTSTDQFIKMHQNFANQIQWLEPLLLTAFFSSDQKAVGTTETRIKGSYRIARIGWGNLAGSDIRKFNQGIGRYANIVPYWREGLKFHEDKTTNYCQDLSPKLKKIEPGAVSGFSSNFRTFGSTDPDRPWHRESGVGMTKPNGVELRIFDHFDSLYLPELCKLVVYIAENSRTHTSKKYVYKNKSWIENLQNIMLNGWSTELSDDYIDDLRDELGLKISTKSKIAYDIMYQINKELYKKHKNGDWTYLMLENNDIVQLPHINRYSWETALMMRLNRDVDLMKQFNIMVKDLSTGKEITVEEFKLIFFKYFNKKLWEKDVVDVMYFLESLKFVDLSFEIDGKIAYLKVNGKNLRHINHFNLELLREWSKREFEDFEFYLYKILENDKKSSKKN
jgi:hypothetical protein